MTTYLKSQTLTVYPLHNFCGAMMTIKGSLLMSIAIVKRVFEVHFLGQI